jgi:Fe-S cluster assembly protein SufD
MTALLESLHIAFSETAVSKTMLDQAIAIGLPSQRSERWKYTSLRALSARRFLAPSRLLTDLNTDTKAAIKAIPSPRIVFVNGNLDSDHSDFLNLPQGISIQTQVNINADNASRFMHVEDVFAKLSTAISMQGLQIDVAHTVATASCLNVVFVSAKTEQDLAIHYHHTISIGENAKLALIEQHISQDTQKNLSNTFFDIRLAKCAELDHARIQQDGSGASHFLRTEAIIQDHASYRRLDLELGAHLSRHDLQVKLIGDGASVHANGSLIADGRRHIDTRLDIQHIARNTSCNLLWRGLATDRSRAVFHGGILIEKGADGSAAHLSNKNLLLSDNAEIDTQPVLVIHADEVVASHGATVGSLDNTHLFYLRARGIPEAEAKAMLTTAFCKETLRVLQNETMINAITPALEKALHDIEINP